MLRSAPPAVTIAEGFLRLGWQPGSDQIWAQLNRGGVTVARCTVERLVRDLGLSGARRGKVWGADHHQIQRLQTV